MVVGVGWWWSRPVLGFSFSQAEQYSMFTHYKKNKKQALAEPGAKLSSSQGRKKIGTAVPAVLRKVSVQRKVYQAITNLIYFEPFFTHFEKFSNLT